jgi:hypothetical protein
MKRTTIDIDNEWRRVKPVMAELKGDKCFYCGRPANEFHHIIPRHMGGDNRPENIVRICSECHCKAHSKRSYIRQADWGRKPIQKPEGFDEIADSYLNNELFFRQALELTGLKRNTFYKLLGQYKAERNDTRMHRNKGNPHKRKKGSN